MKIVYLLESAAHIWGGVKCVLEAANHLQDRGHDVTVLSKSGPPAWMDLRCGFATVPSFEAEDVPAADLIVGTFWTTVPFAIKCGKGIPVHYCQGYEGDNPENEARRTQIDQVYALPEAHKVTVSPHLTRLLQERFGAPAREVVNGIDETIMFPPDSHPPHHPVRVGLVGPYEIAWKDIRTGIEACKLAHEAGLQLELVRITNTAPHAEESELPFPVEWHQQVPPRDMGDLYRSIDVFLGTSFGPQEGFFLPAIEAMACGVPCVLTEIACFQGYGDGQYALFVEPKDPAEMAKALVLVAAHPRIAEGLRVEGLRVASRYTMRNHVDDVERVFTEIIAAAGVKPAGPVLQRPPGARPLARQDSSLGSSGDSSGDSSPGLADVADPHGSPKSMTPAELHLVGLTRSIAKTLRSAAEIFMQSGHYAEAADHLGAASTLLPKDTEILQDLAHATYLKGDDDAALAIYDRAMALGVVTGDLHANRAILLFGKGDLDGAVRGFDAALAAGDQSAETYNNLGVALHGIGNDERARECFETALRLDPDYGEARDNLQRVSSQSSEQNTP